MPYPSQIDRDTIVATAREMIENEGAEQLSLRALADALGVKAPSLYRHVGNKDSLLQAVNTLTTRDLVQTIRAAADPTLPVLEQMVALAHAYRHFGHANAACYMLAYNSPADATRPDADEREQLVLPIQALISDIVGENQSFAAIRGAYAFLHGWVMLELMQQFERGGDLDAHFEQAFRAFLAGWSQST